MWRRLGTAVAASLTAHGALAALLARGAGGGRPQPRSLQEQPIEILTEVEIWREEPEQVAVGGVAAGPGAIAAEVRVRRGGARVSRPAGEARGAESAIEAAPPPAGPVTEGVPLLDPARAAAIAEPDRGPPPPPSPLEMRVPTLRISPRKPRSELVPDGNGRFRSDQEPFVAHVERDGTVRFEDRSSIGVPLLTGRFELTDLAMRAAGIDPYASRKLDYLDRTRGERMQLAAAEKTGNLQDALARTPAALERIWRGPGSPADKRRLLFTLWDECAETGSSEVLATARSVRATIVAFVRRRLPPGSRSAYSEQELEALNARRTSRQRFEPYAR